MYRSDGRNNAPQLTPPTTFLLVFVFLASSIEVMMFVLWGHGSWQHCQLLSPSWWPLSLTVTPPLAQTAFPVAEDLESLPARGSKDMLYMDALMAEIKRAGVSAERTTSPVVLPLPHAVHGRSDGGRGEGGSAACSHCIASPF